MTEADLRTSTPGLPSTPPSAPPAPPSPTASTKPGLAARLRDHWGDPLYRNSYYLMANTLVVTGSGFVFWLLAARLAPPDQVGLATRVVSGMMLVSRRARLDFDVAIGGEGRAKNEYKPLQRWARDG